MPIEDKMFFIVGRGRSGTTLLARILSSHPSLCVAPEGLFVMSLWPRYRNARWDEKKIRQFARDIWTEDRMRRWKLEPRRLEERLVSLLPDVTFARLCALVYLEHCSSDHSVKLVGDKNPHYSLFARELTEMFPKARFLHLVRDYRDNILSYRRVRFDLSSVPGLAYRWRRYNELVEAAKYRCPSRFLQVRFEDLVSVPEQCLKAVCRFLGVEYGRSMLSFHLLSAEAQPAWHKNVSRPLDPSVVGRWRTELKVTESRMADRICQPFALKYGYPNERSAKGGVSDEKRGGASVLVSSIGVGLGWMVTCLEGLLFGFPLAIRARVIRVYRWWTGNIIK